jgi:hypothetical protein
MPLIQWIMQNLTPIQTGGAVIDGAAILEKIIPRVASGGVSVSGTAENIVLVFKQGVEIDGFATVSNNMNDVMTGSVEVSGEAFISIAKQLRIFINYLPGDQVYYNCGQFVILGYYYDLDDRIRYEITNNLGPSLFVYDYDLAINNSCLYDQLKEANDMIAMLSA